MRVETSISAGPQCRIPEPPRTGERTSRVGDRAGRSSDMAESEPFPGHTRLPKVHSWRCYSIKSSQWSIWADGWGSS